LFQLTSLDCYHNGTKMPNLKAAINYIECLGGGHGYLLEHVKGVNIQSLFQKNQIVFSCATITIF